MSRIVGGFLPSLGYAFGGLLGASIIVGLVARTFGEIAPKLNRDRLMLQVELRCPAGWQPDGDMRRPEARRNRSC